MWLSVAATSPLIPPQVVAAVVALLVRWRWRWRRWCHAPRAHALVVAPSPQYEREASAPFATEAAMRVRNDTMASVEAQLLALNVEKEQVSLRGVPATALALAF